jgi:hypothetical protein
MPMKDKICVICKKTYIPESNNQKLCPDCIKERDKPKKRGRPQKYCDVVSKFNKIYGNRKPYLDWIVKNAYNFTSEEISFYYLKIKRDRTELYYDKEIPYSEKKWFLMELDTILKLLSEYKRRKILVEWEDKFKISVNYNENGNKIIRDSSGDIVNDYLSDDVVYDERKKEKEEKESF